MPNTNWITRLTNKVTGTQNLVGGVELAAAQADRDGAAEGAATPQPSLRDLHEERAREHRARDEATVPIADKLIQLRELADTQPSLASQERALDLYRTMIDQAEWIYDELKTGEHSLDEVHALVRGWSKTGLGQITEFAGSAEAERILAYGLDREQHNTAETASSHAEALPPAEEGTSDADTASSSAIEDEMRYQAAVTEWRQACEKTAPWMDLPAHPDPARAEREAKEARDAAGDDHQAEPDDSDQQGRPVFDDYDNELAHEQFLAQAAEDRDESACAAYEARYEREQSDREADSVSAADHSTTSQVVSGVPAATEEDAEKAADEVQPAAVSETAACSVAVTRARCTVEQVQEQLDAVEQETAAERDGELARWHADDAAAQVENERAVDSAAQMDSAPVRGE